ncbi:hypothetical protein AFLA_000534 [Aspergillus flavus NRRL3357]|nr:hypothetical protein AFLA_000534 [Aspergillus flavus NRRL3357]
MKINGNRRKIKSPSHKELLFPPGSKKNDRRQGAPSSQLGKPYVTKVTNLQASQGIGSISHSVIVAPQSRYSQGRWRLPSLLHQV